MNIAYIKKLVECNRYGTLNNVLKNNVNVWSLNDYVEVCMSMCDSNNKRNICENSIIFLVKYLKIYNKIANISIPCGGFKTHLQMFIYESSLKHDSVALFKNVFVCFNNKNNFIGYNILKYLVKHKYVNYDKQFKFSCCDTLYSNTYTRINICPTIMLQYELHCVNIAIRQIHVLYCSGGADKYDLIYEIIDMYANGEYAKGDNIIYDISDRLMNTYDPMVRDNFINMLHDVREYKYVWKSLKYGSIHDILCCIKNYDIVTKELIQLCDNIRTMSSIGTIKPNILTCDILMILG
jgi:hypothetical protein